MGGLFSKTASNVTQEDVKNIIVKMATQNFVNCTQVGEQTNTIYQSNINCVGNSSNIIDNTNQGNNVFIDLKCFSSSNTLNTLTEDITSALVAKIETVDENLIKLQETSSNLRQVVRTEVSALFSTENVLDMFNAYSAQNQVVQVNTGGGADCSNYISGLNQKNVGKIITETVGNFSTTNDAAIAISTAIDADVKTKSSQIGALWAFAGVLLMLAILIAVIGGVLIIGYTTVLGTPGTILASLMPWKWGCK